ncbi:MAG TPA: nuclear transport factor 2 family protein [Pyrinomonadaceae bacterium]|nr:nuclear transport factor 2 family protein [Pyrinomonadaceae bacterium]
MKQKGFWAVTSLAFTLLFLNGCEPSTVTTNAPGANDATVATVAVDKPAIEAALLKIENDWPRVMKEKDGAAVRRVYADDAILVYPDGSTATREEDAKATEEGMVAAESAEVTDLKVTVLDNDSAVVTGRSIMKNAKLNLPGGVKPVDISGEYRFVDTFAKRNGEWKIVASISTAIQNMGGAAASPSPGAKTTPAAATSPAAKATPAAKDTPTMKAAPTP